MRGCPNASWALSAGAARPTMSVLSIVQMPARGLVVAGVVLVDVCSMEG